MRPIVFRHVQNPPLQGVNHLLVADLIRSGGAGEGPGLKKRSLEGAQVVAEGRLVIVGGRPPQHGLKLGLGVHVGGLGEDPGAAIC